MDVDAFVARWTQAPISERAQYQTFIAQVCRLIGVDAPDDDWMGDLDYCFERPVRFVHDDGSAHPGFIDCYRRGSFVLEAKQSAKRMSGGALDPAPQLALVTGRREAHRAGPSPAALDRLMSSAKRQAESYARALDEWPPFLMVVDVGRSIELWADFARQGKSYVPYPDRGRHRISVADLADPAVRDRLARVWTDPMSLDPAAHVAQVTTDIAARLARLVRSIRSREPEAVDAVDRTARANRTALFVMQCIFAMFADSVGLIRDRGFLRFLESYRGHADQFHKGADDFFRRMDEGGHCAAIRQDMKRFNGGLFRHAAALQINELELEALIAAAKRDWASVEPAIFGTLLEQALDPRERLELGAHYTPRAFVERLVEPTIMEPLRADWEAVEAAAIGRFLIGDARGARGMVQEFQRRLCKVQVLDPACGTGNFLYVAMRMMKALEGEVMTVLAELGEDQGGLALDGHVVSPEQFWGLEKNAYAAWIAEMVMWIGYLQWHFQVYGDAQPSEPILKSFGRIQLTDALIACDRIELARDAQGRPVVSDHGPRKGLSLFASLHDEREVVRYVHPRPTPWPAADFIIGNPPFMGGKDVRGALGDGYVDALWAVRQGRFRSADLVTAWWDRAAELLTRKGTRLRRFGLITTNSVTQTFSRRVLEHHLNGTPAVRLVFAIPDHPWIKGEGTADVRIAMTVVEAGSPEGTGRLLRVTSEQGLNTDTPQLIFSTSIGNITPDLGVGADVSAAKPLRACAGLASRGVQLMGPGFIVTRARAAVLGAESQDSDTLPIRPYRNGRDLADRSRDLMAIDLFGWQKGEVRRRHPGLYQHLLETVKPDRDRNRRASYRLAWWQFGEPRRELRAALEGLPRYIATVETAKHRWFRFVDADILADNKLVVVAVDDPFVLGVLSSRVHHAWFVANSARIGVYDGDAVYVKGACFDRFPFPDPADPQRLEIAALAEELDTLRARVLDRHPELTMTGLYNARERMGSDRPLSDGERVVHERGCIGLLDHLHRQLDRAVLAAYGWPTDVEAADVVARLLALNALRAAEEATGQVRWLRPSFQRPRHQTGRGPVQTEVDFTGLERPPVLPQSPDGAARALLGVLRATRRPIEARAIADRFQTDRRGRARIQQTLAVLAVAGSVQRTESGWFTP
ncbi:class I SAM-dependent DNA methyltransferase [Brevundimonas sp.]|uniref:class I SAM-dependent DNA methyltransferase n=1 Tax=Brevundimonas sp. TaxID=1871086 RepID=UPI002AB9DD2A|nr:DNA methyltransferase [Brevundimonas sp.]MDZ4362065.1 type IIL restriction-modification enzyme MmeI [Brevundimonas sp.]